MKVMAIFVPMTASRARADLSCCGGGGRSRLVDAELRAYKGRKAGVSEVAMYIPTPKPTLPYQR